MRHSNQTKSVFSLVLAIVFAFTLFPAVVATAVSGIIKVLAKPDLVFYQVYPFYEGLAAVSLDGDTYGFVDQTGQAVVSMEYDAVGSFSEGLAPVVKDGKIGYVDTQGNVVIPVEYDDRSADGWPLEYMSLSDGRLLVSKDGKWGYLDRDGNVVIPFEYDYAVQFADGLANVWNPEFDGFIDVYGMPVLSVAEIISNGIDGYRVGFSEGRVAVLVGGWTDDDENWHGKFGFADRAGQVVIPCEYDDVQDFSEGYAGVNSGDQWGYIDTSGQVVVPLVYDWGTPFAGGFAAVEIDGKWGVVDAAGEVRVPLIYDWVDPFSEGLAAVWKDGKCGFVDTNGQIKVPIEYDVVSHISLGLAPVLKGEEGWRAVDVDGTVIESLDYDWVYTQNPWWGGSVEANAPLWVQKDGKYGIIQTVAASDGEIVAADKAALTWDAIRLLNMTQSSVTTDLYLPISGKYGSSIFWTTTDASVISASGAVTRPMGTEGKTVTLVAVLSQGGIIDTAVFTVTVPGSADITGDFTDLNFRAAVYEVTGKAPPERIYDFDVAGIIWLDISGRGIESLNGLEWFTSLEYLYCAYNQLTELPALPGNLKYLSCSDNRLAELPALPDSIQVLLCYSNQLAELPELPASLSELNCDWNQLTSLPTLPDSLVYLYCYDNRLTELPELPPNLMWLDCGRNKIESLPPLPSGLIGLYCAYTRLTSLNVTGLIYLQYLNCSYNYMPEPSAVKGLPIIIWDNSNFTFYPQLVPPAENFRVGSSIYDALEDAVAAVPDGGTITMLRDVALNEAVYLDANKAYTLDMGGYTITNAGYQSHLLRIISGSVFIQNGYAVCTTGTAAIIVSTGGTLNIISGEYIGCDDAVYAAGGTVVITSGHFVCTEDPARDGCLTEYSDAKVTLAPGSKANVTPWLNNPDATDVTVTAGDAIDITDDFTDLNFRAAVYQVIGKSAPDRIYNTDVAEITMFDVSSKDIENLNGLQHFVNLTWFRAWNNRISSLPALPSGLEYFECWNNQLTSLPELPDGLKALDCGANQIAALPSLPESLITLYCDDNLLTALPTLPKGLLSLWCQDNLLTELDVTGLSLNYLNCSYNYMPDPSVVIGFPVNKWDGVNYIFYPQHSAPAGVTVSGLVKSYNPGNITTLKLIQDSAEKYTFTIEGVSGSGQAVQPFTFTDVAPGDYTLVVTKDVHTTITVQKITVGTTDLDLTQDSRDAVKCMTPPCGDINGDGMINDGDLAILWMATNYNKSADQAVDPQCDLNGDGMINDGDLAILWMAANYNKGNVIFS